MVVNLSLGTDFGPHDGTTLWEQAIASFVGPEHPGHAIVAAAGNSGSIADTPIHQSVSVSPDALARVPIQTEGAVAGTVQVWITLRNGADLEIGLDGPDGTWIAPVKDGHQNAKTTGDYKAGVIVGASAKNSPVPPASRGAIVIWTGAWPAGTYSVTLRGTGVAELYVEGQGDARGHGSQPARFVNGVREGTVNLPATHPAIIGVGCTVNRSRWINILGIERTLRAPLTDDEGGGAIEGLRDVAEGEVCWFSGAGPTASGAQKPEIAAPGALVISAMSRTAFPGSPRSIFTYPACRAPDGSADPWCWMFDGTHGISSEPRWRRRRWRASSRFFSRRTQR